MKEKSTPMARQPCNLMQQQQRSKWWRNTQLLSQNNLAKFDSATAKQMMKLRNEFVSQKNSCKFDSAAKQSKTKHNKTKQNNFTMKKK
jgi:hypothetical protein